MSCPAALYVFPFIVRFYRIKRIRMKTNPSMFLTMVLKTDFYDVQPEAVLTRRALLFMAQQARP